MTKSHGEADRIKCNNRSESPHTGAIAVLWRNKKSIAGREISRKVCRTDFSLLMPSRNLSSHNIREGAHLATTKQPYSSPSTIHSLAWTLSLHCMKSTRSG
jgi:hypothetical protein